MSNLPWGNSKILTDDEFFNRTQEINNLINLLESTGQGNAPDILLTGIRGVGKTVLLNKIKSILDNDYLVVYMDLTLSQSYQINKMSIKGILDYYFSSFIRECNQKKLKTIDSYINKFFKTNNFKLKKLINFEGIPIPIITAEKDVKNYMDFVFRLPQEIYNKNSEKIKGIIIIIDEFQVIKDIGNYLDSFLWNFRGYVSEQRNVAYVLSGSMSLQDNLISQISGRNGAFGGRMLTINISPFSKTTTKKYLKEKASEIKFSEDGFKRFYKCTSGIPSYINIFARQLSTSHILKEKDIINAFDNNISLIAVHLINEWNRLTIKEKDIVITLIDKPLKRIEIANKLNVKSGSLSDKLNKLQNLGLIDFYDGKYRIIEELLKKWLKTEYKEKGIYPYRVI